MPLVPDVKNCDISVKRAIQGLSNKLGYTGSPTFVSISLTDLTASSLVGTNASKLFESVTVSTGLDYTRPTLSLSHLGIEALTDPGADKVMFWDDSATACKWLGVGNSVAITDVTLDTIQDIRTTASPTFAGLSLGTGELTCGSINRAADTLTLEIGGTAEISVTSTTVTLGGNLIIPDSGTIGSVSDTDVMTIDASGNTTFSVFPITPSAAPDANYEVANKKYVDDNIGGGSGYVDRGDPAAWDYTNANLTFDNTYRDLDLSAIVGSNAALVHLRVAVKDNAAGGQNLQIRKNGNSNEYNNIVAVAHTANINIAYDGWVECDSAGKVEYRGSADLDIGNILVAGWMLL